MPLGNGKQTGRDHNPHAFTYWLAGGGVKGGVYYGEIDEVGHKAVVDKVGVHDLHATILHLLGLDHTKLTYKYNGRQYRLTDVSGDVVKQIPRFERSQDFAPMAQQAPPRRAGDRPLLDAGRGHLRISGYAPQRHASRLRPALGRHGS